VIDTRRRHPAHRRASSAAAGAMSANATSPMTPAGQRHSSAVSSSVVRHDGRRVGRRVGVLVPVTRSACLIEGASPVGASIHPSHGASQAQMDPKWRGGHELARTRGSVERVRPAAAAVEVKTLGGGWHQWS
jgi:hypothetical protein